MQFQNRIETSEALGGVARGCIVSMGGVGRGGCHGICGSRLGVFLQRSDRVVFHAVAVSAFLDSAPWTVFMASAALLRVFLLTGLAGGWSLRKFAHSL